MLLHDQLCEVALTLRFDRLKLIWNLTNFCLQSQCFIWQRNLEVPFKSTYLLQKLLVLIGENPPVQFDNFFIATAVFVSIPSSFLLNTLITAALKANPIRSIFFSLLSSIFGYKKNPEINYQYVLLDSTFYYISFFDSSLCRNNTFKHYFICHLSVNIYSVLHSY